MKLKNPKDKVYSAFHVCEIEKCELEAEKIYASSESRIVDLCLQHYKEITSEGYIN